MGAIFRQLICMRAGVLAIIKVVSAIHPITRNQHYTPHTPNGAVVSNGKLQPV